MTRGAKLGLLTGGLILGAAAVTLAFRAPLLEILLHSALTYRQVPGVELKVESVTSSETAISGLTLGLVQEVKAAKVIVAYDPLGLLAGQIQSVVLDGVRLKLDLRGNDPPLGSLQFLLAGGGSESRAAPALPPVSLRDARLMALTPLGPVSGMIEGELRPDEEGALNAALRFDFQGEIGRLRGGLEAVRASGGKTLASLILEDGALALPGAELRGLRGGGTLSAAGAAVETARLDLTLSEVTVPGVSFEQAGLALFLAGERLEIDAGMATGDGQFAVRAKADLTDFPARPSGRIQLDADIGAQAILWPLLAIPAPAKGRADASLTVQGRLPPLAGLIGGEIGRLKPDDFTGRAKLRFSGIDYPGLIQGLSGELRLAARPGPDFPSHLAADVDLALDAARLNWGDIEAREVVATQKATLDVSNQKISITSKDIGEISVGDFKYASIARSKGALKAQMAKTTVSVDLGHEAGFGLIHDVTLAPRAMAFALSRAGAARLKLQARAKELRARGAYSAAAGYAGKITLTGGHIAVPEYDLAAEGLDAELALAPAGDFDIGFKLDSLRHTADPPRVVPVGVRGEARQSGDAIAFSLKAGGPGGLGKVTMSGRHGVSKGVGEAKIGLDPLVFVPGGAQPNALLPALSDLRNVDGAARAEAALSWTRKGFAGTAALKIDGLSFDSAAARVEGLSLDLALNEIQPPVSAPGQIFRARRIDPGIAIDDLMVRFQVMAGDTPAIGIESAGLHLAGGRFTVADVVVDPDSEQLHLPVRVEGLDLAEVFTLLGVEGLSGDGRLSGTLPLTVTGTTPKIADGRLIAQGPGILRVKSDQAEQALAEAGESADLLLRALEEFHYEELSLTIDQPAEDLAVIGLSMLGNNPDVMEGHPFRFNVNLETDPRRLLTTLREAFLISNRAIGRLWMFGR